MGVRNGNLLRNVEVGKGGFGDLKEPIYALYGGAVEMARWEERSPHEWLDGVRLDLRSGVLSPALVTGQIDVEFQNTELLGSVPIPQNAPLL